MSEYPTDEELEVIKSWKGDDFKLLFDYIRDDLGWERNCGGWGEEEITDDLGKKYIEYNISTGGWWSGNEDIIGAMKENIMLWMMCWQQSRRGGHYVFRVRV